MEKFFINRDCSSYMGLLCIWTSQSQLTTPQGHKLPQMADKTSSMCYSWSIDSSHLMQPPTTDSYSHIDQEQTRAPLSSDGLPSHISVQINTRAFRKKNNGTVSNSATWPLLHLHNSYLYCFSQEAFPEHCLSRIHPSTTLLENLVFLFQEESENKQANKTTSHTSPQITIVTWNSAGWVSSCVCEKPPLGESKPSDLISPFFCNAVRTSSSPPPPRASCLPSAMLQNTTFCNQSEHSFWRRTNYFWNKSFHNDEQLLFFCKGSKGQLFTLATELRTLLAREG